MCTLRKILCRHLTDLCVSSFVAHESGPHPLHAFFSDIPEQRQRSRPRSGRTAASRTTIQNLKTPLRGKEVLMSSPCPKDRPGTASRFRETQTACPDRILRWALRLGTWRVKCIIIRLCMPIPTPYQATAAPATPLSAVGAVSVCYEKAKTGHRPDAAPSLQC